MAGPSAVVTVNGIAIPTSGTSGINVAAASTITIALVSNAGVNSWDINCVQTEGTNSLSTVPLIQATKVVNQPAFSATFVVPAFINFGSVSEPWNIGSSMQFQSIVNAGQFNQNVFTFGVFVIGSSTLRLVFNGENLETNATYGVAPDINTVLIGRALGPAGADGGGDLRGYYPDPYVFSISGWPINLNTPVQINTQTLKWSTSSPVNGVGILQANNLNLLGPSVTGTQPGAASINLFTGGVSQASFGVDSLVWTPSVSAGTITINTSGTTHIAIGTSGSGAVTNSGNITLKTGDLGSVATVGDVTLDTGNPHGATGGNVNIKNNGTLYMQATPTGLAFTSNTTFGFGSSGLYTFLSTSTLALSTPLTWTSGFTTRLAYDNVIMPADADYNVQPFEFNHAVLEVTNAHALTATRNFKLPVTGSFYNTNSQGAFYMITNLTTGGQALNVQPGNILIPNGQTALVFSDNTNYYGMGSNPTGPAGGDLSGSYPNPTVVGLQGQSITGTATAGQFIIENSAATHPVWTSLSGDVSASTSTPGNITVTGLQTHPVLAQTLGNPQDGYVLTWKNSAPYWYAAPPTGGGGGGSVSWNNDLVNSTSSNQWVASISGNGGGGGTVPMFITALQFASAQTNVALNQASTSSGSGTSLTVQAQGATGASHNGGQLNLSSGSSGSANAGNISLQLGGTELLSISGPSPGALTFTNTTAQVNVSQTAQASTSSGSGAAGKLMIVAAQSGQAATGASNNGGVGGALTLSAGTGGNSGAATSGVGGNLNLSSGAGGPSQPANGNISLQLGGTELCFFDGSSAGSLTFSNAAAVINVTQTARSSTTGAPNNGQPISVTGQTGQATSQASTAGGNGANVTIQGGTGGAGTSTNGIGGNAILVGGTAGSGSTGGNAVLQGGSGTTNGNVTLKIASTTELVLTANNFLWDAGIAGGTFGQASKSGSGGQTLNIQAQNVTGGFLGGQLALTSGSGSPNGNVSFQLGGTELFKLDGSTAGNVTFTNTTATPNFTQTAQSAVGGVSNGAVGFNFNITPQTGQGAASGIAGAGGNLNLTGGAGGASSSGTGGAGGNANVTGGAAGSTNSNGGNVVLTPGAGSGTGTKGTIQFVGSQNVVVSSAKTANYTIVRGDYLIRIGALSGAITITLPASPATGDIYVIKMSSSVSTTNTVTISPSSGNIDGQSSFVSMTPYNAYTVVYNGAEWSVI